MRGDLMADAAGSGPGLLRGLRVLDCTHSWAGPVATQFVAFFGAEVIHVEPPRRPDRWRGPVTPGPDTPLAYRYPGGEPGKRPFDRNGLFNEKNTNKLGLSLDIAHPRGRELFGALVRQSDAVVTNFGARTIRKLGLDHESLAALKPDIVSLSLTGFGETGPEADYAAWGTTIEALSGLSNQKGYPDGPPLLSNMAYGDPVGGIYGGVALLTALWHRQRTGQGQHIDLSLLECSATLCIDAIAAFTATGMLQSRSGNRHPDHAPRGCYRCAGEDRWLALTVASDAQWATLREIMGNPAWADAEHLSSAQGRRAHHDELDRRLAEWTCTRDRDVLMHKLQEAGIAAGSVLSNLELLHDPQLLSRGFFCELDHPEAGRHSYPRLPFHLSRTPGALRRPAPGFGEHTDLVLRELLGLGDEDLRPLLQSNVVGRSPSPPSHPVAPEAKQGTT